MGAIGVSNWTIPQMKDMLSWCNVKPQVNQVEIHPFLPNDELVKFCFDNDIMPAAYSPLGSQNQLPTTGEKVNTNPTLNAIAEKGGNSLAQVLIAWGLRRGYVVLPKSSTPSRIESNFKIPQLTDEDFNAVNEVAKGRHTRFVNMGTPSAMTSGQRRPVPTPPLPRPESGRRGFSAFSLTRDD